MPLRGGIARSVPSLLIKLLVGISLKNHYNLKDS